MLEYSIKSILIIRMVPRDCVIEVLYQRLRITDLHRSCSTSKGYWFTSIQFGFNNSFFNVLEAEQLVNILGKSYWLTDQAIIAKANLSQNLTIQFHSLPNVATKEPFAYELICFVLVCLSSSIKYYPSYVQELHISHYVQVIKQRSMLKEVLRIVQLLRLWASNDTFKESNLTPSTCHCPEGMRIQQFLPDILESHSSSLVITETKG